MRTAIGARVTDIARRTPDRDAVIALGRRGEETRLTWRQLDHRSNECAAVLRAEGVTAGDVVVVALPNGADHVVATLGAWKLNATVVPLDPALPDAGHGTPITAGGVLYLTGQRHLFAVGG